MIDNAFAIIIIGLFALLFTFIAANYKYIEERLFNRLNSKISNTLDKQINSIYPQISKYVDEKLNIIKIQIENDYQNHTVCNIHGNISDKEIRDIRKAMDKFVSVSEIIECKDFAERIKSEYGLK